MEWVQGPATKLVLELKDLTYEERLNKQEITTVESRRERGDLISIYKMVNRLDKVDEDFLNLEIRTTRGNGKKLKKVQCIRDIKKYSSPHRAVDTWNVLDMDIANAVSVHRFKAKLDKTRYKDGSI